MKTDMEHTYTTCDIEKPHNKGIETKKRTVPVMFDHDQEDGKSKVKPYFETKELDMCQSCFDEMTKERRLIYAYGAMGYNKYYLKSSNESV